MDSKTVLPSIHVVYKMASLGAGGVETLLVNIHRNIDTQVYKIDYLLNDPHNCFYNEEVVSMGSNVFIAEGKGRTRLARAISRYFQTYKLLRQRKPHILHLNETCFSTGLSCVVAKFAKVPVVIAHAHSDHNNDIHIGRLQLLANKLSRQLIPFGATHYIACSQQAAKWFFPKRVHSKCEIQYIFNGIDAKKYEYNTETRNKYREVLNLNNHFVVGYVARMDKAKNHKFLLDVFKHIDEKRSNSKLLLIGDGSEREELEKYAYSLGISEKVLFLGRRKDVNNLMQAMDVFAFPSTFEGLGIVAIEAQAAGLKTICRHTIPKEACVTEDFIYMPEDAGAAMWAEQALLFCEGYERKAHTDRIVQTGYDIRQTTKLLQDLYSHGARQF